MGRWRKRGRQAGVWALCGLLGGGLGAAALPGAHQDAQDKPQPLVVSRAFPLHGRVVLVVNVGDVHVVRNPDAQQIRLQIEPRQAVSAAEMQGWIKRFEVEGDHASLELKLPRTGHSAGPVTLYVPQAASLKVDVGIGDITVAGVEGDKDLRVSVGELVLRDGNPSSYGHLETSVRVGDLKDSLFHAQQRGWLGREANFDRAGRYSLVARVGIGDLTMTGEDAGL